MKQPDWTTDEVLLGVNAYFEIGEVRKVTLANPIIIELSQTLKQLPIHKNKDEIFRNLAGVKMTLQRIASLDKESVYSMKNSSALQKDAYDAYKNNQLYLRRICEAIKACLPLPFEYKKELCSPFSMTGNILWQYHLHIEQQSQVAIALKQSFQERRKSICQICGVDLCHLYGDSGISLLEQHYAEDIADYSKFMKILQSKFVALCPTCHKFAHSQPKLYLFNNLKQSIRGNK